MKKFILPVSLLFVFVGCSPLVATQVSAGGTHTCALLDDGEVLCWGGGKIALHFGQLGYGNTNDIGDDESPEGAGSVDIGGKVSQLSAGEEHTCALLDTGDVRCWGHGTSGRLGYGNTNDIGDDETPANAGSVDVGSPVANVSAGFEHTCALLTNGAVRCWGDGFLGQLGYGNGNNNIGDDETPSSAGDVNIGGTVVQLDTGVSHTCALLDIGTVRCWGSNSFGAIGYENIDNVGAAETPASVGDVNVGGTVVELETGNFHTCVLLDTGVIRCWGSSLAGQLGYGNENTIGDFESPASAGDVTVGGVVTNISAGGNHTCALLDTGAVRCWGANDQGQLGYGNKNNIGDDESPASAGDVNVGGTVVQLTTGAAHTCALLDTGAVRCWGQGFFGELGYGNTDDIGDDESPASAGDVLGF